MSNYGLDIPFPISEVAFGGMLFLYGVTGLLIPLAHDPPVLAVALLFIAQLFGDIFVTIYLIAEISLRQAVIPNAFLGRVNASMQFVTQGVGPVAAILAGILGTTLGLRLTILIGVIGVIFAGSWLLISPVRQVRYFEESSLSQMSPGNALESVFRDEIQGFDDDI